MTEVNKSELSKFIKKSNAIVTRLSNDGVLNDCYTPSGKKLYLEKSVRAIIMNKGIDYLGDADLTGIEVVNDTEKTIFTATNISELQNLLDQEPSASKKIDMMDKFWSYKIKHQKFLSEEGDLIPISDAKAIFERISTPFNQAMNDLPYDLKARFTDVNDDAIEWMIEHINSIKLDFQDMQ